MAKTNTIRSNSLQTNSVRLNGVEGLRRVSLQAGEIPDIPPTYTLSASVTNGKVSATRNGSAVTLPFTANEGDTIVLSVTPNDGYAFEGWNDGNTDNPRTITMNADVVLSAQCVEVVVPPAKEYIQFEDAEVERVLMSKGVSSDGVGITIEDAEKVTSIGTWFRDNGLIKSFLELSLFSNLKKIGGDTLGYSAFYSCDQLQSLGFPKNAESIGTYCLFQCNNLSIDISQLPQSIKLIGAFAFQGVTTTGVLDLPNLEGTINWGNFNDVAAKQLEGIENLGAVTSIAGFMKQEKLRYVNIPQTCSDITTNAFLGCDALEQVICRATTPPTLGTTVFSGSSCPIYVPDASLEAYKTATNWNQYSARIKPLSEYVKE
jgi:hypothetical protein